MFYGPLAADATLGLRLGLKILLVCSVLRSTCVSPIPVDPPCRLSCSQFRVSTTGDDLVSSIHDYQSSAIGSTLLDHAHHSWDAVHQLMRPTRFANDECYMDRSFSCDVMCVFDLSARSQDVTSFQRSNCACFIARLPPPSTGCVQCKLIRSRNIAEPEN